MRRLAITLLAGFVLVSISTRDTIQAQEISPSFTVGGGLSNPIDAGPFDNAPAILGRVSLPVYSSLHAVLEGHYNNSNAELEQLFPPGGESAELNSKLIGANLGIMLRSSTSPVSVYGLGGIGLARAEKKSSVPLLGESASARTTETVFSYTVGGGVQIPINPSIGVAIEARYSHAETEVAASKWMPITVSIVFSP